jgi:hypothetical protein
VVVTADHGEELFDHGSFFHGGSLYDEMLHVPLIVRMPGGAHAGAVVPEPVSLVDVVPAIAEVLGLPAMPGWQGQSMLAPVRTPGTPTRPVLARAASPDYPWRFGVRTATHKLVMTVDPPGEQLFDLVADPREQTNRIDDPALAGVAAALREQLAAFRAPLAHSGFQLRAVAPSGMSSVLEVRVRSTRGDTGLANPDRIGPLRPDRISVTPDGKVLVWRTVVGDTPIGIRFDRGVLPSYHFDVGLEFSARALGVMELAPRAIFLGGDGRHPAGSPFTYEVKPGVFFGPPTEEPPLRTATAPQRLEAFVGEPATLYVWFEGVPGAPAQAPVPLDEEQRRKLRELGYAE